MTVINTHTRSGGGKPFASGGGFSGMSATQFRRYWLGRPEVFPLFLVMGAGIAMVGWGLTREFSSNPRYTLNKERRGSSTLPWTGEEMDKHRNKPFMPHHDKSFSLGPFTFRSLNDMRAGQRPSAEH